MNMADALRSSYVAPVFKRPRLEICPENGAIESPFDSLSSEEGFRSDFEARPFAQETLSTDPILDINGGDSGFHDQSPVSKLASTSSVAVSEALHPIENYSTEANHPPQEANLHPCENKQSQRLDKDSDDNDCEDVASNVSDLSALSSDLSNFSGAEGQANSGPFIWVQRQMENGIDPREILMEVLPKDTIIPSNLNQSLLWRIVLSVINEPPQRTKLSHINTISDVVSLMRSCKKIVVLTGAGVSVSCGIPDFRSRNGVYARLSKDYPDLPDPQAMFDIIYFRKDPRPFFKFAKEIYPGLFQPSPSHHFIRLIEKQGKLLRNYTQNIDTLEKAAGIEQVITCHGSFATATCTVCRHTVDASFIKDDIFAQRIPYCPVCPSTVEERGIMKPDIVFFGEGLSDEFHQCLATDKEECDLLIVMGSSLKVRPVALIPNSLPPHVPQILINREPLNHLSFDVELLGDCDIIIGELSKRLAKIWSIPDVTEEPYQELQNLPSEAPSFKSFNATIPTSDESSSKTEQNAKTNDQSLETSDAISSPATAEEESNSCDCRGMSAIKLDDSQDGSEENPDVAVQGSSQTSDAAMQRSSQPFDDNSDSQEVWPSQIRESIATRLPDKSYLFLAPNRYIFQGAEVYNYNSYREPITSNKNSAYDSDSPGLSSEDDDDNETFVRGKESANSDGQEDTCENLARTKVGSDSGANLDSPDRKEPST